MNPATIILRAAEATECLHKMDEYQKKLLRALTDLPIDVAIKILTELSKLHLDSHERVTKHVQELTANNK